MTGKVVSVKRHLILTGLHPHLLQQHQCSSTGAGKLFLKIQTVNMLGFVETQSLSQLSNSPIVG